MVLDKVSRALLVKLFYQNNNNSAAALREYRRIKGIRRGPLSAVALKNMIRKFELTGDLGIAPGRGRRPVTPQIVEEVTVAMAENAGRNLRSSSSARAVCFTTTEHSMVHRSKSAANNCEVVSVQTSHYSPTFAT